MGFGRLVAWAALAANLGAKVVAASAAPDACSISLFAYFFSSSPSQIYYSPFAFDEGRVALLTESSGVEVNKYVATSFKMLALGETGWESDGEAVCDGVCWFEEPPRLAVLRGSVLAVEDARKRTNVFVKEGSSKKWTALPVLNEPLVGLEANGAGELRLQTAYRGDGCAGVCLREYAVSERLQLVGETLLPAQADPLNIAVGTDAIAYVNRTDAVLEGYQVVVRSRGVAAPVSETVLPSVDLSGQFEVLQLVLSGDQVMLRTGAQVINATGSGEYYSSAEYWSSIRVFRRSAAAAPSYELMQSLYDSRNISHYFSVAVMRVSGKRMAVDVAVDSLDGRRGDGYSTWALLEFNGTAWAPSTALEGNVDDEGRSRVSSIGFAGDRVVFGQPFLGDQGDGPYLVTLPADCNALSTAETVATVAVSVFALCVLCAIIFDVRKRKSTAAAKRTAALAVSPAEL
jgi:hypothetical protein